MIQQLVYLSKACKSITSVDVDNIIKASKVNNPELGITGILVFYNGHFLQLLEGESANIDCLFGEIEKDSRHENLSILYNKKGKERLAKGWSMSLVDQNSFSTSLPQKSTMPFSELEAMINQPTTSASERSIWQLIKLFVELKKL